MRRQFGISIAKHVLIEPIQQGYDTCFNTVKTVLSNLRKLHPKFVAGRYRLEAPDYGMYKQSMLDTVSQAARVLDEYDERTCRTARVESRKRCQTVRLQGGDCC